MAIDSPRNRASAGSIGVPFRFAMVPDGVVSQEDRQTLALCYGGILASIIEGIQLPLNSGRLFTPVFNSMIIAPEFKSRTITPEFDSTFINYI